MWPSAWLQKRPIYGQKGKKKDHEKRRALFLKEPVDLRGR